jgi:spore coat polysaccharide biosynthesis protein SpsF
MLPLGISVEVFSFEALEKAWKEDTNPAWREHVTTYFLKNPQLFRIGSLDYTCSHSSMRLTVDTPEDLALIRLIFETFGHNDFSWKDAVKLLERNPGWLDINKGIVQRSI